MMSVQGKNDFDGGRMRVVTAIVLLDGLLREMMPI